MTEEISTDWKELARQYAETKMKGNWVGDWDRKDEILIGIFYGHMLYYIEENYYLIRKTEL